MGTTSAARILKLEKIARMQNSVIFFNILSGQVLSEKLQIFDFATI